MSKDSKKTKQNKKSEIKTSFERIDREFFMLYCEDHQVLKESMDDMIAIARGTKEDRVRVDVRKFLIEQLIGKSAQAVDWTSKGEKITAGIFVDKDVLS